MSKTPGLELTGGIDPRNAVPVISSYGPYADFAEAKSSIPQAFRHDGMTVKLLGNSNEYWWESSDYSDAGLKQKINIPSGTSQPTVRYVYLVADAADQTAMGGTAKNVYITAQSAWDAAVVIAAANSLFQVLILVGSTTIAIAGNVVMDLNTNATRISWIGQQNRSSQIGSLTYTATSSAFIVMRNILASNVTMPTFTGGLTISITCENTQWGNITSSNAAATGAHTFNITNCNKFVTGNWIITGSTTTVGMLNINATNVGVRTGQLSLGNYSATLTGYNSCSALLLTTYTLPFTLSISNYTIDTLTLSSSAAVNKTISFNNVLIPTATVSLSNGTTNDISFNNCTLGLVFSMTSNGVPVRFVDSYLQRITNLSSNAIFQSCSFYSSISSGTMILLSTSATGVEFYNCSLYATIATTLDATSAGTNVKFTSGNSTNKGIMGSNVVLT